MKKHLYLDSGYVDMRWVMNLPYTFIFVIGGRGTGKTYGLLSTVVEDNKIMMYMRRQQTEAELVGNPEFSPFNTICRDKGWTVDVKPVSKYNSKMTLIDGEEEKKIGYTCALSTIKNIRGFDASDVDILIYDEFIPEDHTRKMKKEHLAFLNAYETINRNRELTGRPPLKCISMTNSNTVENELFKGLGLLEIAERMQRRGQEMYMSKERDLCLIMLRDSQISNAKSQTALYKMASGVEEFVDMSIENKFRELDDKRIGSKNLSEYVPRFSIGQLNVYKHKSNGTYYCSKHRSGQPRVYGDEESEVIRCRQNHAGIWLAYIHGKVFFEDYACHSIFKEIFA